MQELQHDLLNTKYTRVLHEDRKDMKYKAPHHFEVYQAEEVWNEYTDELQPPRLLSKIDFQCGPINDVGVNGVMNEDLIAMVITRLEHFNKTDFQCRENSLAITKLEEALMWLGKRTASREKRGVEGTHRR